jgi:hypothetical protein
MPSAALMEGEDLVWIHLVSDIPHQPVMWRIEHIVQSNRQLDSSEAGGEMPTAQADAVDQKLAQLGSERGKRRGGKAAQVCGGNGGCSAADTFRTDRSSVAA